MRLDACRGWQRSCGVRDAYGHPYPCHNLQAMSIRKNPPYCAIKMAVCANQRRAMGQIGRVLGVL
jgi:hypothetical protein